MKNIILFAGLIFGITSCSQNDSNQNIATADLIQQKNLEADMNPFPVGTNYSFSEVAIQGTYNQFKQSLNKNEAISIIAEVDHSQNAKSIGEELNYTKLIFFGNPNLGTPLMQKNQLVGLDLPQKVLFYKDREKNDVVLYNSVHYLRSRYGLDGVGSLDKISDALEKLVSGATKRDVEEADQQSVGFEEGIVTKQSNLTFQATYSNLRNAIASNPNINIIAELDHQENAAKVGLELEPTKILIFGNPNLGTPLMLEEQSIGLDLPQKMLVWENSDGEVYVSYNYPYFIAERHRVENNDETLDKISAALDKLSNIATGN
jgi:uncharacterized protein (DUF302 family)